MINKEIALMAMSFEHKTLKNADGSPLRARSNGKCKTWVTEPTHFSLPVKYGLKQCFYIDNENADEWVAVDAYHFLHAKIKVATPTEVGVFSILPTAAGTALRNDFLTPYLRTGRKPNLDKEFVAIRRIEAGEELIVRSK